MSMARAQSSEFVGGSSQESSVGASSLEQPTCLVVEIGGTKLQVVVADLHGTFFDQGRTQVDPAQGALGIRRAIETLWAEIRDRRGVDDGRSISGHGPRWDPERLIAIGIGFGGPVDRSRGRVVCSHQITGWDDIDIEGWARTALIDRLVVLENDADAAALGEACFGAGLEADPVVYVTVGSGIGGGLVLDGAIYRGAGRGALEVGHLRIADDSGRLVTLESLASGWALDLRGRSLAHRRREASSQLAIKSDLLLSRVDGDPMKVSARELGAAALDGDDEAAAILRTGARTLGIGLAQVVTLLAPQRLIVGGGVALLPEPLWFDPLKQSLSEHVFAPFRDHVEILPARCGERVVPLGMIAAVRQRFEAPSPLR